MRPPQIGPVEPIGSPVRFNGSGHACSSVGPDQGGGDLVLTRVPATSLARMWRDQGKHAEAHELLAPVYGWFTEGFGTPVLKEAKTLLEALNG